MNPSRPTDYRRLAAARRSRRILHSAAFVVLFTAGCMGLTGSRNAPPQVGPVTSQMATPADLIAYLNRTSAKVEAIESADLALDIKGAGGEGGVSGTLYCQKPRYFRMRAKALGRAEADFGSNEREFWYWIARDNPPYVYHCDYTDLARGGVRLPFPFQPDWVMECLGMATITAPAENFRVDQRGEFLELTERTVSLSGQPITKVTTLRGGEARGDTPQVIAHRLFDARNQLIAQATVQSVRREPAGGSIIPTMLKIEWPAQKMELQLKLDGLKIYSSPSLVQQNPDLFRRGTLQHLPAFDLARGSLDGQPTGVQRARGLGQ